MSHCIRVLHCTVLHTATQDAMSGMSQDGECTQTALASLWLIGSTSTTVQQQLGESATVHTARVTRLLQFGVFYKQGR